MTLTVFTAPALQQGFRYYVRQNRGEPLTRLEIFLAFLGSWRRVGQLGVEPGAGEGPVALGGRQRYPQGDRGLRHGHTREEAQLDQFGALGVELGQPCQCFVECQQVLAGGRADEDGLIEIDAPPFAAVPDALLSLGRE